MEEKWSYVYPVDLQKNVADITFQNQGIPMLRPRMQEHFSNAARLRNALQ